MIEDWELNVADPWEAAPTFGAFVRKYINLQHRLLALTERDPEDEDSCWVWKGPLRGRTGNYPRINVRFDGAHKQVAAHRLSLVLAEVIENGGDWDLVWPLYLFYSLAGFEADHCSCNNPVCVNPEHLEWLSREEHLEVTLRRRGWTRRGG